MKPYLRLAPHANLQSLSDEAEKPPSYQEALTKLIPVEVVGLYLAGKNGIEAYFRGGGTPPEDAASEPGFWLGWTAVCLVGLILYRRWATSDTDAGVPPEWPAVALTAVSFLVWIYSFGDVFKVTFNIWHALVATLLVAGWTFTVPLIYRRFFGVKKP